MTSITGYGADYEKRISEAKALALCPVPPRIGYERSIESLPRQGYYVHHLALQNVSGIYVLASHTTKRSAWAEVFGPQYKEFT